MLDKNALLRALPAVDEVLLLVDDETKETIARSVLVEAIREEIEHVRAQIMKGDAKSMTDSAVGCVINADEIAAAAAWRAVQKSQFVLRRVINGTGIVLHTNLGRAPLANEVAEHMKRIATSYSTLEYDVSGKQRGDRHTITEALLQKLTGAQAGIVVNNNAAAVMLMLSTLSAGKEVVVSRGELVEIGGSFRVPEIMQQGGALLREVGTTNKTKLRDYEQAIDASYTGMILKVHTSNYKIIGFKEETPLDALYALSQKHGLPLVYDLGSGALADLKQIGFMEEPIVNREILNNVDVLCFSGDKLLGGPQAGIIVGKKKYIDFMKRSPLMRVFRCDKLVLAALEATLQIYLDKREAQERIPVLQMLFASDAAINAKAEALAGHINAAGGMFHAQVVKTQAAVGGGSLPGEEMSSWAVMLQCDRASAEQIDRMFRQHATPIVGRIHKDAYILDVRTIKETEFSEIIDATHMQREGQATS